MERDPTGVRNRKHATLIQGKKTKLNPPHFYSCTVFGHSLDFTQFYLAVKCYRARMTTLIKMKVKKSDDHTNIDKYRVGENITEYQN